MRLLDLFCGAGLGAWGYWKSGRFSEIVGIDQNPTMKRSYAFDFICGDAMRLDYDFLMSFDYIHASPPCQAYSKITPDRSRHIRLVAATHLMLVAAGVPYTIENVEGSGQELRPNWVIDGYGVGLPMERKRYFHVSQLPEPVNMLGRGKGGLSIHNGTVTRSRVIEAMGLDVIPKTQLKRIAVDEMKQGIPPAMTRIIAEATIAKVYRVG